MNNRQLGKEYEEKACTLLKSKGYLILQNNYVCRFGEIDIIAIKEKYICFIEVKYRKNDNCGYPEEAVNISKRKKICKTSQFYMFSHKQYMNYQMRFDVVSVMGDEVRIYENAFDFVL